MLFPLSAQLTSRSRRNHVRVTSQTRKWGGEERTGRDRNRLSACVTAERNFLNYFFLPPHPWKGRTMSRKAKDEQYRFFTVSEPRTHEKGHTEYKVTARVSLTLVASKTPRCCCSTTLSPRWSPLLSLVFPVFPFAVVTSRRPLWLVLSRVTCHCKACSLTGWTDELLRRKAQNLWSAPPWYNKDTTARTGSDSWCSWNCVSHWEGVMWSWLHLCLYFVVVVVVDMQWCHLRKAMFVCLSVCIQASPRGCQGGGGVEEVLGAEETPWRVGLHAQEPVQKRRGVSTVSSCSSLWYWLKTLNSWSGRVQPWPKCPNAEALHSGLPFHFLCSFITIQMFQYHTSAQSPLVACDKASFLPPLNAQRPTGFLLPLFVTGRFDEAVIEERRVAAEAMFLFTTKIPALYNSPHLKEFLRVRRNAYMLIIETHTHVTWEDSVSRDSVHGVRVVRPPGLWIPHVWPPRSHYRPLSSHCPSGGTRTAILQRRRQERWSLPRPKTWATTWAWRSVNWSWRPRPTVRWEAPRWRKSSTVTWSWRTEVWWWSPSCHYPLAGWPLKACVCLQVLSLELCPASPLDTQELQEELDSLFDSGPEEQVPSPLPEGPPPLSEHDLAVFDPCYQQG